WRCGQRPIAIRPMPSTPKPETAATRQIRRAASPLHRGRGRLRGVANSNSESRAVDRIQGRRGGPVASALSLDAHRARLHDCLRTHQQAQPRGPHGPASAARASRVPRLQGQRRGGSARWVEKKDVLAMRWAWGGQGTGRPIGGPNHAFAVDARQGLTRARTAPRAHGVRLYEHRHVKPPLFLLFFLPSFFLEAFPFSLVRTAPAGFPSFSNRDAKGNHKV